MTATLRDLADATGLSISVVSRALNPRPDLHARVADETRERVQRAAERLGYARNRAASALRRGRSASVGVFLPATADRLVADMVIGIGAVAAERQQPLQFAFGMEAAQYHDFLDACLEEAHAGLLSYPGLLAAEGAVARKLARFRARGGKLLLLNGPAPRGVPTLAFDEASGARQVAERFAQRGCAECWVDDAYPARGEPFAAACAQRRLPCSVLPPDRMPARIASYARERRGAGPLGLFATSDLRALDYLRALRAAGLRIGEEVLLIGYDDQCGMDRVDPPLSTVQQPFRAFGRRAAERLLAMLDGDDEDREREVMEPRLIVRSSA